MPLGETRLIMQRPHYSGFVMCRLKYRIIAQLYRPILCHVSTLPNTQTS